MKNNQIVETTSGNYKNNKFQRLMLFKKKTLLILVKFVVKKSEKKNFSIHDLIENIGIGIFKTFQSIVSNLHNIEDKII